MRNSGGSSPGCPHDSRGRRGRTAWWLLRLDEDTRPGTERRPLVLGATNDQFVEVKDGLVENEEVILNPRAVVAEARAVKEATEEVDVDGEVRQGTAAAARRQETPQRRRGAEQERSVRGRTSGCWRPPDAGGPGGPGGGGPGAGGQRRAMNPMQFDKNGDGKLTKDELPEQMQALLRSAWTPTVTGWSTVRNWRNCVAAWEVRAVPVAPAGPDAPSGQGGGGGRPGPPQ